MSSRRVVCNIHVTRNWESYPQSYPHSTMTMCIIEVLNADPPPVVVPRVAPPPLRCYCGTQRENRKESMTEEETSTTLRLIAEARKEEALMKTTLRARLWEQYEKELLLLRYRISRLANQAAEEGHSLSRIGRAYGTSNWKTIRDLLALTETEKQAEDAVRAEQIEAREKALA